MIFKGKYRIGDKAGIQAEDVSIVAYRRLEDGKLLILITNQDPYQAIENYKKRWGIEGLFGHLKTGGFCFEDTHLQAPDRILTIMSVVSIAYLWALEMGRWEHARKPIRFKTHGRKAISIFRYGLNKLQSILHNIQHSWDEFLDALALIPDPTTQHLCVIQPVNSNFVVY